MPKLTATQLFWCQRQIRYDLIQLLDTWFSQTSSHDVDIKIFVSK